MQSKTLGKQHKPPVASLLLANAFPPVVGGIETFLYQIAVNLRRVRPIILAPHVPGDHDFDERTPLHIERRQFDQLGFAGRVCWTVTSRIAYHGLYRSLQYLPHTLQLVRRHHVQVVQCGHIYLGLLGYWLWRWKGLPYLVYTYGQEVMEAHLPRAKWLTRAVGERIFRNAAAVITNCDFTKRHVLRWGVEEDRVVKIPHGVDHEFFTPGEARMRPEIQRALKGKQFILTVGRLVERKGQDIVIKALARVREYVPNLVYVIVGDGPDRKRLQMLTQEHELNDMVLFVGRVPDEELVHYYRGCDVFIMPSRADEARGDVEGLPQVYLQANACGRPAVGGRSGGVEEAILDGVTGLVVDPTDVEEVTRALVLLLKDREYATRLGQNGRARVEREMNWKRGAQEIEALVHRIVTEAGCKE